MKFFFFGDSICFGQGISIHKGWIPKISQKLSEMAEKEGIELTLINNAINGRTTRQALETMPYDIQSHHPDLVLLQFGMNDCNYWESDRGIQRVSPLAFKANLHEMIKRTMIFGAKRVFLNTNHPTKRDTDILPYTNITYEQSNRYYNELIREVYKECDEKVVLNDIERAFDSYTKENKVLSNLLLADRLHLSEEGHLLYFEIVFPKLMDNIMKVNEQGISIL